MLAGNESVAKAGVLVQEGPAGGQEEEEEEEAAA